MTEENYTHKIVMFDVNSTERVAYFVSEENAEEFCHFAICTKNTFVPDDKDTMFNVDNIVQMNPKEEITE